MKTTRLPPLNALRAFEAVSRTRQVSRAARELSVTPSAVSHLIRRLEEDLEIKLVQRSGRTISLTDWGETMGSQLHEVFHALHKITSEARASANQNTLTVSLRPYFALKWLAPRLNKFWTAHPEVELRLHHTNRPVDFLADNVDLAIEWSTGGRPGVSHELLIPGELTPAFSPQMPRSEGIKTPGDLLKYTLLKETDYDSWEDWFRLADVTVPKKTQALYVDDSNVRNQAALDGQGVELSCHSLIVNDVRDGKLLAPFGLHLNRCSYYLVQPATRKPVAAAQRFRDWLLYEVDPDRSNTVSSAC